MVQNVIQVSVGQSANPTVQISETDVPQATTQSTIVVEDVAGGKGDKGDKGDPGERGLPGPGGGTGDIFYTAGVDLSGHRAVRLSAGQVVYVSQDKPEDLNEFLGITTGASLQGDEATVRPYGIMDEPSWNWDVTIPIFLGVNGVLTQTPPTSGFLLIVAKALLPTEIFIDPKTPIVL